MGHYFSKEKRGDFTIKEVAPPKREVIIKLKKVEVSPRNQGKFDFFTFSDISGTEKLRNFGVLPLRNLNIIFLYCSLDSILECSCSCRLFNRVINCTYFWKNYYLNFFPKYSRELESREDYLINWKKLCFQTLFNFENKDLFYRDLFFRKPSNTHANTTVTTDSLKEINFSLLVLGDRGVGITSLLRETSEGAYFTSGYVSTTFDDFKKRTAYHDGKTIKLKLFEPSGFGQERDRDIRMKAYWAQGVLICFSIDNKMSFEKVGEYIRAVRMNSRVSCKPCPIIIAGCKCDLEYKREVDEKILEDSFKTLSALNEKYCRRMDYTGDGLDLSYPQDYCECSSKERLFLHLPFGMLLEKVINGFEGEFKYVEKI